MPDSLEKKSDHDILITLVETVRLQHQSLADKVDGVKIDVKNLRDIDLKEIKDGTQLKLLELEKRIKDLELLRDQLQPVTITKQVQENTDWIKTFRISYKATLGTVIAITSIITFILTTILHITNLLGK